jgi:hypothetical protein
MSASKPVLTSQNLADLYQVPADTVRMLIDRLGLGTRLGHWRIVQPTELGRLEAGLITLGYKIPPGPTAGRGAGCSGGAAAGGCAVGGCAVILRPPAVQKLVSSPAVQAVFPVVRSWLVALLLSGEKASRTGLKKNVVARSSTGHQGSKD